MQFDLADLKGLIAEHEERFGSADDTDTLHGRIEWRAKHFAQEMPPVLPAPYEKGFRYQTDILRQKNIKLKSRLRENPFVIEGDPVQNTATQKAALERALLVLNQGFDQIQKRENINILSALADGINRHCYSVLHWVLADHMIPAVPEREYLEELPEDPSEAKRYEEDGNGYRETGDSVMERHKANMARAGFPFYVETIPANQFMFTEDRSLANGLAIAIVRREVGLFEYAARRQAMGKDSHREPLSINETNKRVPIYGERDAPNDEAPDAGGFRKRVKIYQVWTRTEFYEYVDGEEDFRDAFEHPYCMPPFAIAYANVNENETSLVRRYEPALEGLYRVKPAFDYWMSLYYTMAESNAMPMYVLVSKSEGMPMLADDGTPLVMSRNAAMSMKIPDGYELVKFENQINEGFVQLGQWIMDELEKSAPSAGDAEVSASTQPWAIRLQQAMANVEPRMYLENIAQAIDICVTNVAKVMSMPDVFGEPIAVYARLKEGKVNKREIVSIEPKEIESLDFTVSINPTSAAEQITREQFGMEKLQAKLITHPEFIGDYEGKPNPEAVYVQRQSWWYFADKIQPAIMAMEHKAHYGSRIVMDPTTGDFLGAGGVPVTPEQAFQQNGQQPPEMTQTSMGQMAPIQTPGTVPMQAGAVV